MVRIGTGVARARAQLRGGVLRLSWLRGAVINEADARAAVTAAGLLSAGRTHPLLVELSGLAWMSWKAQKIFAAPSSVNASPCSVHRPSTGSLRTSTSAGICRTARRGTKRRWLGVQVDPA